MATRPLTVRRSGRRSARRVALLGFGTVGQSVARILTEHPPAGVRLTHIFNRGVARKRVDWVPRDVTLDRATSTTCFAVRREHHRRADGRTRPGRHVGAPRARRPAARSSPRTSSSSRTTARSCTRSPRAHGGHLRFEAAVAGGIPIIVALRDGLGGDRISRVLGHPERHVQLHPDEHGGPRRQRSPTRSRRRRQLGFAEADPTDDVEGYDARAKLAILCARGAARARARRRDIATRSITRRRRRRLRCTRASSAAPSARSRRRSGIARRMACARGRPPVARADASRRSRASAGSQNIVVLRGHYGGDTVFSGSGAGGGPTSVAVVSDLAAIARQREPRERTSATVARRSASAARPRVDHREFVTPHYLRFIVRDRPGHHRGASPAPWRGTTSTSTRCCSCPADSKDALPFVVTVEACPPAMLAEAVRRNRPRSTSTCSRRWTCRCSTEPRMSAARPTAGRGPRAQRRRGAGARGRLRIWRCRHRRANLGAGFDALAVALQLYLRVRVCAVLDGPPTASRSICAARALERRQLRRARRSARGGARAAWTSRARARGAKRDPRCRAGLGSSAAATVAGLRLYERLAGPREGSRPADDGHPARSSTRTTSPRRCSAA